MSGMHFSVLGPLEVTGPDGPVALGGPRQRAVLAMLVIHADQEVPTNRLIDGVWAEAPPPTATRTLHAYVARLRSLLEPDRPVGSPPTLLTRTTLGYRLRLRPGEVDWLVLERAVAGARLRRASGDVASAAVQLRTALASWRGPALGDLRAFPALNAAAERLERLRGDAVAELVEVELQLGRHTDLLPQLAALVEESPFDERLWSALALAQYRSNRQADALDTVRRARRTLVTELGIEPGPSLRALQQAILTSDPGLDTAEPSVAVLARPHPGLEGREDQLKAMRTAWSLAVAGHGGSLVLTGPQGIGRSRLLRAFAAEVHAAGGRLVEWRQGAAPKGVDEAVPDVATMVLADDVNSATTVEFSDLVHWVDAANEQPLLVLLTIRDGYVSPELGALLARIDPAGERSIPLTRLEPDQIARVATSYVGGAKALDVAVNVAKNSAGVPEQVHAQIEAFAGTTLRRAVSDSISAASADWSGARRGEAELVSSLLELSAVESAATAARALATGPPACPYPGLAPFDALAAGFFAGREELVSVGVARLAIAGSLLVVGASGVGKSSLVRAGIIPALLSGAVPGSDHWRIDLVTPTLVGPAFSGRGARPDLLVVDQVEELLGLEPPARADFITGLLRVRHEGGRVVLVARSDKYPAVATEPRLDELVAAPQLLVGTMTDQQLARAIQIPIRRAGMDCEEGLVTAIVADVSGELGALPLLSTTMRELWDLCPSGVLTLAAYGQVGGIRDAVARLAERTYATFDVGEREATRELLLRMASPGDGGAVVRGFVDVAAIGPVGPTRIAFDRLIADRLVTVDEDHASVAHEALFAHWPRLAAWLEADSDTRSQRARVEQSARSWAQGGRLASDLLRGPRLSAALELLRDRPELVSANGAAFVSASETADSQERLDLIQRLRRQRLSNRRLRLLIGFAAVALLVATVAAGAALRAQRTADTTATQSLARGLGAQALTIQRLDLSLLLAAQSAALDPGVAAHSALLAALARAPQALRVFVGTGQRLDAVTVGGQAPTVISIDRSPAAESVNLATGTATPVTDPSMDVSAAALSASGRLLALGGGDRPNPGGQGGPGHITFLDAATMKSSGPAIITSSRVEALRFDGGADLLAALLNSGETDIFDIATRARVWSGKGARTPFATTVDFSTSGRYLTASAPAVLWNVGAGTSNLIPLHGDRAAIRADGNLLAVATGPTVRLVRRVGLSTFRQLDPLPTPVQTLAFSPDGTALAGGSTDGTVVVWDVATGKRRAQLTGHDGAVNSAAFTPDGQTLITGAMDGRVVTWDLSGRHSLLDTVGALSGLSTDDLTAAYGAASTRSGRMLIGAPDGSVRIARFPGGDTLQTFAAVKGVTNNDAEISRDGRLAATARSDDLVSVWDLGGASLYADHPTFHTVATPGAVAISPDDRNLAWGDVQGGVTVASLTNGQILWHRQLYPATDAISTGGLANGAAMVMNFSPDGSQLVVSLHGVATALVRADGTGMPRMLHFGNNNALSVVFSPDGKLLLTADNEGTAALWTISTGKAAALGTSFSASTASFYGSAFDPRGDLLATYAADGSTQLWDTATASPIGPRLVADPSAVLTTSWVDNDTLDTFQADGTVRQITVGTSPLILRACSVAGRTLTRAEWDQYLPGRPYTPACV